MLDSDIDKRQSAGQEREEGLTSMIIRNIKAGIVGIDREGRFTFFNRAATENLGYTEEEFETLRISDIDVTESGEDFLGHMEDILLGNARPFEVSFRKKDGIIIDVEVSPAVLCHEGRDVCIVIWRDITERKQTEKALYWRLGERVKELTCLHEVQRAMHQKLSFEELCRFIIGRLGPAMQFPEIAVPVIEIGGIFFAGEGYSRTLSYCMQADIKDEERVCGRLMVYYTEKRPFLLPEEQDMLSSIAESIELWLRRDIARKDLIMSESGLREAQGIAHIGSWTFDLKSGLITFSDEMFRIYGLDPEKGAPSFPDHQKYIHPEDWERLKATIRETVEKGDQYQLELRLLTADCKQRTIFSRSRIKRDSNGEAVIIEGTSEDITERKLAEEELKKAIERAKIAEETLDAGSWRVDLTTNRILWSDNLCHMHGIKPEDFDGSLETIRGFIHPEDLEYVAEKARAVIKTQSETDFEYRIITADGKEKHIYGKCRLVFRKESLTEIIGMNMDVTERKRTEAMLKTRMTILELAPRHSLDDLLQETLDEVCLLTKSHIGFYHFVEPDQKTISLQAWSSRTKKEFCTASGKGLHYSIDKAGVWVDAIHQQRPVIHNDYASLPHKKGLPEGHAPVVRELVVPIFREGKVVAIIGVGNKETGYNDKDVETVTFLSDVVWEITERKRAEEALSLKNKLYTNLVDCNPAGIYRVRIFPQNKWKKDAWLSSENAPYEMELISDRFCEILGVTKETYSKNPGILNELIHPQDKVEFAHIHSAAMSSPDKFHWEGRIVVDEEIRFVSFESLPTVLENGDVIWTGFVQDVTERKRAEEALRESEALLREVAANYPNSYISIIEKDYTIGFSSGQEFRKQNIDPDLFMGKNLAEVFGEQEPVVREHYRKAFAGQESTFEIFINDQYQLYRAVPLISEDGSINRILVVVENITDRRRLEQEALTSHYHLVQLGQLSAGVAHEINNPNNAIMSNSQLLKKIWDDAARILDDYHRENGAFLVGGLPFPEKREVIAKLPSDITECSRRINNIVVSLKSFAVGETGVYKEGFSVNKVAADALVILHNQIKKRTDNFVVDLKGQLPLVLGNSHMIEQVIINVLMNALEAVHDRKRSVRLATGYDSESGFVVIEVVDEGVGMEREMISRVTEAFFTTKRGSGGTGLGLSISAAIVKEHEGALCIESAPGEGTTVSIRLPAMEGNDRSAG